MNMSTEVCKLEKDLCRCCHAEGTFKSFHERYIRRGVEEVVYAAMLRHCFNIELSAVSETLKCAICEVCIQRLYEAYDFRHQVLMCEKKLRDLYYGHIVKSSVRYGVEIKEEVPEPEGNNEALPGSEAEAVKEDDSIASDIGGVSDDDTTIKQDSVLTGFGEMDCKPDKKDLPSRRRMARTTRPRKAKTELQKIIEFKKNIDAQKKIENRKKREIQKKMKASCPKVKEKEPPAADSSQGSKKKRPPPTATKKRRSPIFPMQEGVDFKRVADGFQCSRCTSRVYKRLINLKSHVKVVHFQLPKYICQVCDKRFPTEHSVVTHKLVEHNIDATIKCNACDVVFLSKLGLKYHMDSFHMLGQKHKCDLCDFETYKLQLLKRHKYKHFSLYEGRPVSQQWERDGLMMKYKHKTVKDFHCKYCKKSFLRRNTLRMHEKIHTGDKKKVCKECGQAFVQKASWNYHMVKYHPEVHF